jgi:hypothetical protein
LTAIEAVKTEDRPEAIAVVAADPLVVALIWVPCVGYWPRPWLQQLR